MRHTLARTAAAFTLAALLGSAADAAKYWIRVNATPTGPYTVTVRITTNLPGTPTLAADMSLAGQADTDPYIGTHFKRVRITAGKGSVTLDGHRPRDPLPAGKYNVTVSFHPMWNENRDTARKLNVTDSLTGSAPVHLKASGVSAQVTVQKKKAQGWVMRNLDMDTPMRDARLVERFGRYVELPLESGNPRVLKMWYFPSIDMTFMVNVLKDEVVLWRMGRANR